MMTVSEVSRRTGVSIRTLHYYDEMGLLKATATTEAGYRLYDDTALERLQQILLFRELEFPLKEIRRILADPSFDRDKALEQQIHLLELRREHIHGLIALARQIRQNGGKNMNFEAFDTKKMDDYAREARAAWGDTAAYKEYEKKSEGRTRETEQQLGGELMAYFRRFGEIRNGKADSPEAEALVRGLQQYITENYYRCTDEILLSLGEMYAAGGDFTENIDSVGGTGTALFARDAIFATLGK